MSTKNKQQLKQEFQSGTKITQAKLEDLIDSSVNKVDDLSIDADGNVGIGTTSVSSGVKLDVAGIARFKTGTNLDIELGTPGGNTGVIFNRSEESNFQRFDIYNRPSDNYFTLCYSDDHSNSNGLYIKKGGNVGIGTTSPSQSLHVTGDSTGNAGITVENKGTGNSQIRFMDQNNGENGAITMIKSWQSGNKAGIAVHDGESNILNIRDGNVGIGTSGPKQKLHVFGPALFEGTIDNAGITFKTHNDKTASIGLQDDNDQGFYIHTGGQYRLSVNTNGNVGIGTHDPQSKLDVEGSVSIGAAYSGTNAAPANGLLVEGNVGIGTNSPEVKLDILQDNDNGIRISKAGNTQEIRLHLADHNGGYGFFKLGGDTVLRGNGSNSSFDGNVGIGTTSPSAKLEVNGNMKVTHIVQEDWQDLTLENGWTRFSTTYNPPQYFKDSQGIVHLRGLIKDGTAEEISTLPTAYSPSFRELHIGTTNRNVSCRIDITNAGVITLAADYDNAWVSLDGITFRTA